jgi:hypothetical protein
MVYSINNYISLILVLTTMVSYYKSTCQYVVESLIVLVFEIYKLGKFRFLASPFTALDALVKLELVEVAMAGLFYATS